MNRQQLFTLSGILLATAALSACAADGTFAGNGKPVDKQATISATCDGIAKANIAFQTFAASAPGMIDANGMAVEGAAVASVGLDTDPSAAPKPGSVCAKPYVGDLAVAENAALTTLIKVTQLLATWKT